MTTSQNLMYKFVINKLSLIFIIFFKITFWTPPPLVNRYPFLLPLSSVPYFVNHPFSKNLYSSVLTIRRGFRRIIVHYPLCVFFCYICLSCKCLSPVPLTDSWFLCLSLWRFIVWNTARRMSDKGITSDVKRQTDRQDRSLISIA